MVSNTAYLRFRSGYVYRWDNCTQGEFRSLIPYGERTSYFTWRFSEWGSNPVTLVLDSWPVTTPDLQFP